MIVSLLETPAFQDIHGLYTVVKCKAQLEHYKNKNIHGSMPKSSSVQSKKYSSYTPLDEVYVLKMISTCV